MSTDHAVKRVTALPATALVRFPPGLAGICLDEIRALTDTWPAKKGCRLSLETNEKFIVIRDFAFRQLASLALFCGTGREIFYVAGEFRARSREDIGRGLRRLPLAAFGRDGTTISLRADSRNSRLWHEGLLQELAVPVFREQGWELVTGDARLPLRLDVEDNRARLLLPLGGQPPLFHRGYKGSGSTVAPMAENLARALALWLQNFAGERPGLVYVPFAGSGTPGLEALLLLRGLAPGGAPRQLAMEHWPACPGPTLEWYRRQAAGGERGPPLPMDFLEIDEAQLRSLRNHGRDFFRAFATAGMTADQHPVTRFMQGDYFRYLPRRPEGGHLMMLMNPPRNQRLFAGRDVVTWYRRAGRRLPAILREGFDRITGYCLAAGEDCRRSFLDGARPERHETLHFSQGGRHVMAVAVDLRNKTGAGDAVQA